MEKNQAESFSENFNTKLLQPFLFAQKMKSCLKYDHFPHSKYVQSLHIFMSNRTNSFYLFIFNPCLAWKEKRNYIGLCDVWMMFETELLWWSFEDDVATFLCILRFDLRVVNFVPSSDGFWPLIRHAYNEPPCLVFKHSYSQIYLR